MQATTHGLNDETERDWTASARQGDREAFGHLVEAYMRRAYAAARGLVGSPADARDLSQEAFVKAFQAMATFEEGRPFYPWFYKILRNLCFNHLRDRSRRARLLRQAAEAGVRPGIAGFSPQPEALAQRSELREAIWAAMAELNEAEREALVLRELEGHSYKEIAELAGCPLGTVMSRLYSARRKLRAALDGKLA